MANANNPPSRTGRAALTVLESAGTDDPAFSESRIIAGRGLGDDPNEIVLASTLANQLGISTPGERVRVRVERSRDGVPQMEEREFTVAGIVQGTDRGYVCADVIRSLDLWVSHVTRHIGEERSTGPVEYPTALVWSSEDEAKVRAMAERMGLVLQPVRQDRVPTFGPDNWFKILTDRTPHSKDVRVLPVYVESSRSGKLIVLTPNDPRWAALGAVPDNMIVTLDNPAAFQRLLGGVYTDEIAGITTPLGLAFDQVDVKAWPQQATYVITTNPDTLSIINSLSQALTPARWPSVTGELAGGVENNIMEATLIVDPEKVKIDPVDDETEDQAEGSDPGPSLRFTLTGSLAEMQRVVKAARCQDAFRVVSGFDEPAHVVVPRQLDPMTLKALRDKPGTFVRVVPFVYVTTEAGTSAVAIPASVVDAWDRELKNDVSVDNPFDRLGARPADVLQMDDTDWRHEVARQTVSPARTPAEWHVRLAKAEDWDAIKGAGFQLESFDPRTMLKMNVYRATRLDKSPIGREVLSALQMARPTFLAARGELALDVPVRGGQIAVQATLPTDPERFSVFHGRWIDTDKSLVVAESDLARLGLDKADCLGKPLTFRWTRKGAFGRDEQLEVPFTVVGVSQQTTMHTDLAWRVRQWTRGEVNFIDGEFRTPMEQEIAYGARRVKMIVGSPEDVLAIARQYEEQGFLVSHQIDKQQALTDLAGTLRNLTMLLCGAALLLSVLVVVTSVYLFYEARKSEIASLRSLGVSRRDIIKGTSN